MNVGVITPTRGDRPKLLNHCLWQVRRQTLQGFHHVVVDDPPVSERPDLGQRIKRGMESLKGCDVIAVMEDDDWYAPDYLSSMVDGWEQAGRPALFGIRPTIYYHLGLRRYKVLQHPGRSSLASTLINPAKVKLDWPDELVMLDLCLWKKYRRDSHVKTFTPSDSHGGHWMLSVKHGIGLCGGKGHGTLMAYPYGDSDLSWLRSQVDETSFGFYSALASSLSATHTHC